MHKITIFASIAVEEEADLDVRLVSGSEWEFVWPTGILHDREKKNYELHQTRKTQEQGREANGWQMVKSEDFWWVG